MLAERIVRGALDGDMVRLHGAIVAAFEIHQSAAERDVFTIARELAAKVSVECHTRVADAISSHTNNWTRADADRSRRLLARRG
ncbi:MAG TPA: hypothetical protein VGL44_09600 [Gaiellales bacterium]